MNINKDKYKLEGYEYNGYRQEIEEWEKKHGKVRFKPSYIKKYFPGYKDNEIPEHRVFKPYPNIKRD